MNNQNDKMMNNHNDNINKIIYYKSIQNDNRNEGINTNV